MTTEDSSTTEHASVTATPADAPPIVTPPVDERAAAVSPEDPHLHCLHWAPELTGDPPRAAAHCCWPDDYVVTVSVHNPALTGEHGPRA